MAKQHKTAANTSNGPVAFKSLLKPWLHSSSGSKHLMFLFIYKRTSNDYVAWIVSVVYCEFKCAVQILPWIQYTSRFHVQSLQNQDKLRLMKRQTAHGLMWKLRDLAFAQKGKGGRSTKWNCDVNLIAVKIETAAGGYEDALFQAKIHLLPDSSLAEPGIKKLLLERSQSCSEVISHLHASFFPSCDGFIWKCVSFWSIVKYYF